jgi:hypothetical protein
LDREGDMLTAWCPKLEIASRRIEAATGARLLLSLGEM